MDFGSISDPNLEPTSLPNPWKIDPKSDLENIQHVSSIFDRILMDFRFAVTSFYSFPFEREAKFQYFDCLLLNYVFINFRFHFGCILAEIRSKMMLTTSSNNDLKHEFLFVFSWFWVPSWTPFSSKIDQNTANELRGPPLFVHLRCLLPFWGTPWLRFGRFWLDFGSHFVRLGYDFKRIF